VFVLVFGAVFLWWGLEFTDFAWYRISELAELPLWMIHIAWPIAGLTWILFQGERMWDDIQVLLHGEEPQA
jgi:TRAP-type C4-dicarboxylate transport system permease small subunit